MNKVIDLLKNHRSIRKFEQEPVSDKKALTIIEAAGAASTSNFIQAYSVIHVTDLKRYNKTCSNYYQNRSTGSRENTWTRQISDMMSVPARPHMKEFLKEKGFGIK